MGNALGTLSHAASSEGAGPESLVPKGLSSKAASAAAAPCFLSTPPLPEGAHVIGPKFLAQHRVVQAAEGLPNLVILAPGPAAAAAPAGPVPADITPLQEQACACGPPLEDQGGVMDAWVALWKLRTWF